MDIHRVSFTSLGLVVLDEIQFPHREPLTNVVGGSGAYATLGARLFLPHALSSRVGWMLHIGSDFPESIQARLKSWNTTLRIEKESNRLSTRGLLVYKDTTFGPKSFKYTTPILSIEDSSLANAALLNSKAFHFLDSPQSIGPRVSALLARRAGAGIRERPLIIWEPAPPSCKPENLPGCLDAVSLVDVFSPNHLELLALYGESPPATLDKVHIEDLTAQFLQNDVGPDGKGTVIVRAGECGCVVSTPEIVPTWLPPFYDSHDDKVVDPTGAGNAFLGAYAVGFIETESVIEAACYGSVGASFAIEQVGMPEKSTDGEEELWNGVNVLSRLREYTSRLSKSTS
ncbi:Ribokinase-like protein [Aspergillus floccosus]